MIQQLVQFLTQVSDICHQYDSPPSSSSNVPHNQHHENFISFRSKLSTLITSFHSSIPSLPTAALAELKFHLTRSFGSVSRFDYGTSHELSFILYLLILRLTSTLTTLDAKDTIRVLDKYWEVSELVRKKFGLEQAGKRGVWKKQDHDDGGRMWFDQGASQARGMLSLPFFYFYLFPSPELTDRVLLTATKKDIQLVQPQLTPSLHSLQLILHLLSISSVRSSRRPHPPRLPLLYCNSTHPKSSHISPHSFTSGSVLTYLSPPRVKVR